MGGESVNLYIDCEWNSFGGELISMAICSECGLEFYEVLHCNDPHPWVAENVIPVLDKDPVPKVILQTMLEDFLHQFESVHVVADWPEDIAHFMNTLITGPGERLRTPPLTAEVMRIDAASEVPHNALYDARAIRKHCTENSER